MELPPAIRNYCEDAKARALTDRASSLLFRTNDHPGYGAALLYHLAFANGWKDRIRLIFERIFVPEEPDWKQVRLPRPLHFLYYTVRPMRLVRERLSMANR
jgi:hypothetical protein